ncbi:YfhO family protein [Streptomyces sp. MA15]|uniref:YfhO family protein n=1 Tax=Streptomyces sp. MA15 TaxID=3055061 RepID=UPI0025B26702|nr:YfhO family protein [Streptomyces sp. MA15]MDN3270383.1 YfhO family protein [Streptomyces sp. MA15]
MNTEDSPAASTRPAEEPRAATLAAALTLLVVCAGNAVAGAFPFGTEARNVNDLGNQYVPFHAHLWDLLHGQADGDLFVNWQSGLGSSFLPDLGTYLASPFALLVALFPRAEIDLAVFVVSCLKMAAAACAMSVLLLRLRRGSWWVAGCLGASYGLCGWVLADAVYNTMWLDGLIALPLLCLVAEWALAGRRPVLGVLVAALCWTANFYTAYMATLAAGLFLLARACTSPLTWRDRSRAVLRAGLTAAAGVGLAAPVVLTVYFGTRHAYPGRTSVFAPIESQDLVARLLPATYSFSSPALYVDAAAFLLALSLPFNKAVPRAARGALTALIVTVVLSLQWAPTNLVWNGFATPNGSAYRAAFVVCGLLVIAAWTSFAHGLPTGRPLYAALCLVAVVVVVARGSDLWSVWTLPVTAAGTVLAAVALWGLVRGTRSSLSDGRPARWCLALITCAVVGQSVAVTAYTERLLVAQKDDYAPWGERQEAQRAAIDRVDGWPRYRTDPGREQTVGNDPLVVGGQGTQYYSSVTSDVLARTLVALGNGYTSRGRSVQSLDNPVTDVVFSVGARLRTAPDPHQSWFPDSGNDIQVLQQPVPPLVTVHPAGARRAFGDSVFRNQEMMLGSKVYTLPRLSLGREGSADPLDGDGRAVPAGSEDRRLTGSCPVGTSLHMWAPHYAGTASQVNAGAPPTVGRFRADHKPVTKVAAVQYLGDVPGSGRFTIRLDAERGGTIPAQAIGCLHTDRLRAAAARLTATGAREVKVDGHRLTATLPAGSKGVAVVAVPRIAGWHCAVGHAEPRPAGQRFGLIAVALDGASTDLECTFRPPGLRAGTAVALVTLLALCTLAGAHVVRTRRIARGKPC